jgi:2,4-dienoyl-CoA reductase-like NADH-dependent reductase (Old Yellow Enzyme family)
MTQLADPLTLPCGAILRNRIAKAAMSEHLASSRQEPTRALNQLYERWSRGGAGLVITGNVMVDAQHLEAKSNVVLAGSADRTRFAAWAEAGTRGGNALFMQINHPGRQTPRHVNPTPMAPSAVPPVNLFRRAGVFGQPRAMTETDIEQAIEAFARAALFAKRAGFTGVQVHGAHGYLVSQFLSPLTNQREDAWGGSLENRARFGRAVLAAIRSAVGSAFPVAIKLNSADFQRGGFTEDESLRVLQMLKDDGVDLVEISGGSYESRVMLEKGSDREAFFLDFARKARAAVDIPLMVTGGFRSRAVMEQALASGALDLVGIARPFTHNPDLGRDLTTGRLARAEDPPSMRGLSRLGGTSEAMMSVAQMAMIAKGKDPARGVSLRAVLGALVQEIESLRGSKR